MENSGRDAKVPLVMAILDSLCFFLCFDTRHHSRNSIERMLTCLLNRKKYLMNCRLTCLLCLQWLPRDRGNYRIVGFGCTGINCIPGISFHKRINVDHYIRDIWIRSSVKIWIAVGMDFKQLRYHWYAITEIDFCSDQALRVHRYVLWDEFGMRSGIKFMLVVVTYSKPLHRDLERQHQRF